VWWAWWIWGELRQAREWLEAALEHAGDERRLLVAQARLGAAGLAWAQGDYDVAERWALQAAEAFAVLGEDVLEGSARNTLALVAHGRERHAEAERLLEAALEAYRRPEVDPAAAARNIAVSIDNLGSSAFETGDLERAERHFREALALNHARGDVEGVAMNELHLAMCRSTGGDPDAARSLLVRALRTYRDLGFLQYAAECLESALLVSDAAGDHAATARLLGASDAMRGRAGSPPVPFLRRLRERQADRSRGAIGDTAFGVAFAEGRSMPPDEAMRWTIDLLES
jgi:tetratricopeptide (TPR) repeat protein